MPPELNTYARRPRTTGRRPPWAAPAWGSWVVSEQGASASEGQAAPHGTLSVPPSWADAVLSVAPLPALDANLMPGGWGAAPARPSAAPGLGISKLPLGGIVGRDADGAVQGIGFRASVIAHSPVAW